MKLGLAAIATVAASGCAASTTYYPVSVIDLAKNPTAWDGKKVEVVGIASSRFEDRSLYSTVGEYCARRPSKEAVWVQWPPTRDFRSDYEGRMVRVRGLFRYESYTERPTADGRVLVTLSLASAGPGPLKNVTIVKRLPGAPAVCSAQQR